MQQKTKCFYDFGTFRLDPVEHVLLSASGRVPLTLKAFETHRREVSPMNRPKLEIYCISAKFPTASATDSKCDDSIVIREYARLDSATHHACWLFERTLCRDAACI